MLDNMMMNQMTITEKDDITAKDIREGSVGWMLNVLAASLNIDMKKQLDSLNLTIHQFMVMMTLLESDGVSQTVIGKKVKLPGYAITRNLDALEEQGLIERKADKSSRRRFSITLTDQGRALAPSLFQVVIGINADLMSGLTSKEADQLTLLLNKLINEKVYSSA